MAAALLAAEAEAAPSPSLPPVATSDHGIFTESTPLGMASSFRCVLLTIVRVVCSRNNWCVLGASGAETLEQGCAASAAEAGDAGRSSTIGPDAPRRRAMLLDGPDDVL